MSETTLLTIRHKGGGVGELKRDTSVLECPGAATYSCQNPWGRRFRPLAFQDAKHVLDHVSLVAWLSADDLAADGSWHCFLVTRRWRTVPEEVSLGGARLLAVLAYIRGVYLRANVLCPDGGPYGLYLQLP